MTCQRNLVHFEGRGYTADLISRRAEEDEDASQMMMDYQPEELAEERWRKRARCIHGNDEATEEGKKVKKEASLSITD